MKLKNIHWQSMFRKCPKTGRPILLNKKSGLLFIIFGLLSLIWFLTRVIPRPSRAAYPCMKIAAPIASGFIIYMTGLLVSTFAFVKARVHFRNTRYAYVVFFVIIGLAGIIGMNSAPKTPVYAKSVLETPNTPIGEGKGIFPGRVVWAWDPEATDENWVNKKSNAYYLPKNTNMDVTEKMTTDAIMRLTGASTIKDAWDSIFVYFNMNHDKGRIGYQEGEQIFIKMNMVGGSVDNNYNITDIKNYNMSRTSPQAVLAVLRHLINVCGVPQENIGLGDPLMDMSNDYYNLWHDEFPNVIYVDKKGRSGRVKSAKAVTPIMHFSDKGAILRTGDPSWIDASKGNPVTEDSYYTILQDADYLINISALKAHARAGVTMGAKNHFGSHTRDNAQHLHMGLVSPDNGENERPGYHKYRIQVDLMGHRYLGGNTLLFIVDGLWGGSEANDPPCKFLMPPFNNDWPNSIFASLDPVAIESVGLDFLHEEFTEDRHPESTWPQMDGVDDYLHQTADPANWPEGIVYDPENDGTPIGILGVHEHWNNPVDKQYARNLGQSEGIELVMIDYTQSAVDLNTGKIPGQFALRQNYPNPFNPVTNIEFELANPSEISLNVYNMNGQKITVLAAGHLAAGSHTVSWNGLASDGSPAASGMYLYRLNIQNGTETIVQSRKMLLVK